MYDRVKTYGCLIARYALVQFCGITLAAALLYPLFEHLQLGSVATAPELVASVIAGGAKIGGVLTGFFTVVFTLSLAFVGRWKTLAFGASAATVVPAMNLAQFVATVRQIEGGPYELVVLVGGFFAVLGCAAYAWTIHAYLFAAREPALKRRINGFPARLDTFRWRAIAVASALIVIAASAVQLVWLSSVFAYYARHLAILCWFLSGTVISVALSAALAKLRSAAQRTLVSALLAGLLATPVIATDPFVIAMDWHRTPFGSLSMSILPEFGFSVVPGSETERYTLTPTVDCPSSPPEPYTPEPISLPDHEIRNVILISVDTLRSDMIHRTALGKEIAPNLNTLSKQGIHFSNARATYAATVFSVGSALTGLSPSQVVLSPRKPKSVFSRLEDKFDDRFIVLPDNGFFRAPITGSLFSQGARRIFRDSGAKQAGEFIDHLKSVKAKGMNTFAWLHFFEPHANYKFYKEYFPGKEYTQTPSRLLRYMSEVAYSDHYIGRVMTYLQRTGWMENTLVIIFSDHGEALGEKGYHGHHSFLENFLVDVPLIVLAPNIGPAQSKTVVSVMDIAPTIHHFMDSQIPPEMTGRSLLELYRDDPADKDRVAVSEAFALRGDRLFSFTHDLMTRPGRGAEAIQILRSNNGRYTPKSAVSIDGWHLIVDHSLKLSQLYDSKKDYINRRNVSGKYPHVTRRLQDALAKWYLDQSQAIFCH